MNQETRREIDEQKVKAFGPSTAVNPNVKVAYKRPPLVYMTSEQLRGEVGRLETLVSRLTEKNKRRKRALKDINRSAIVKNHVTAGLTNQIVAQADLVTEYRLRLDNQEKTIKRFQQEVADLVQLNINQAEAFDKFKARAETAEDQVRQMSIAQRHAEQLNAAEIHQLEHDKQVLKTYAHQTERQLEQTRYELGVKRQQRKPSFLARLFGEPRRGSRVG